jgi:hypothetical protein
MDLIFKRYSSPFLLLDTLIVNNQFNGFINDFIDMYNEDKIYELWLHRGYGKSYKDFRSKINLEPKEVNTTPVDVDKILKDSMSVLEDIQPG